MPWFEETTREIQRIIAKVRPVLRGDWLGRAGDRVRSTLESISDYAKEHHATAGELLEDAIELSRHKLEGVAEQERAAALQKFAEAEKGHGEQGEKGRS